MQYTYQYKKSLRIEKLDAKSSIFSRPSACSSLCLDKEIKPCVSDPIGRSAQAIQSIMRISDYLHPLHDSEILYHIKDDWTDQMKNKQT